MTKSYLSIQGVSKRFGLFAALEHVSIDIAKNEFVCLLGPSGCGKTTLLRMIAGLEQPTTGSMIVAGREITSLPPAKRNIAMMFQSYALFPNLTAAENIAFGLQEKKLSKQEIAAKVEEALDMVDLYPIANKYPAQLSGGQQQRIALARAISLSPDVLLLDEPLSALDAKVRQKLRREIRRLHEKFGMTTVMVTHDQDEALTMADKIVVMNHGEVVQVGTPEAIYNKPATPFVADFIGAINFIESRRIEIGQSEVQNLLAIRPEHVRIMPHESECGIPATIQESEFRGAFYRIYLEWQEENGQTTEQLTLDLPASQVSKLGIQRGQRVWLELPMEHLLRFEQDQAASAKEQG
ncbi:putative 2-aminoethylphosphonate ABC transporter ATP-binding protein [Brevibacillus choshinensis]|uniref:putative 2-aminoethylphosphonate ABC transporter ATP-binding protein n=1 Tax=Brevibacillus choshinensis TaxID=54911 RepID=UPI002E1E7E44|nr:putative 2-aminoethylphosphonate ABC transporter ATP-binding protein [Brevibacillus choshinensis]MED4582907.1 putative 2-aminoethylphosphonate ABC transporter ATP-binding protein [Brevibacillus choshinensis]MED4752823.1 putative 2-aminoethylphosphonate ABC transporter ATP-binding protein [Brevibacillus choshinensis]